MHWYDKDGKLFDVDLKEGRKQGYAPSVTEIIHEFSNSYGLDLYKQRQMFLASLTMPRPEGITDEAFYDLVVEDSRVHSEKAKGFGLEVHRIVTNWLKYGNGKPYYCEQQNQVVEDRAEKIFNWIIANKDNCIVDFKTQNTIDGKFRQPYDSWVLQLAGYKLGSFNFPQGEYIEKSFYYDALDIKFGGQIDYMLYNTPNSEFKLINLIVSSNEDIPIKPYIWKSDKIEWATKSFIKMVDLYRTIKKL